MWMLFGVPAIVFAVWNVMFAVQKKKFGVSSIFEHGFYGIDAMCILSS